MGMPEYKYTVCANIHSEETNDYIHHFDGENFNDEGEARDFWNNWWPEESEVRKVTDEWLKDHPGDELIIEIGLWNNDTGEDIEFYSEFI